MKTVVTFLAPLEKLSPGQLWFQAGQDPGRYLELMRAHGYIVPSGGAPQEPLPCGWAPDRHRAPLEYDDTMVWEEPSDSGNGFYLVRQLADGRWYCPCSDFEYRGMERPCKHIMRRQRKIAEAVASRDGRGRVTA
jgi:hypothetical protein